MISVIVPIYNVESCLRTCIDSIINQSYHDFELLLVDDGSTDSCGKICDEYAAKDDRVRAFHKKNGGLSDARNYGIEQANGEYLTFIDSDDYIASNYLETLYQMLCTQNADISVVCCKIVYDMNADVGNVNVLSVLTIDPQEAIRRMLIRSPFGVSAWGKLFKRELFEKIQFPVGRLYEDLLTTPYIFEKCQKVVYTEAQMYFYYQRPDSITNRPFSEQDLQAFNGLRQIVDYIETQFPEIHDAVVSRYIDDSLNIFFHRAIWQKDYIKYARIIKKKDRSIWKEGLKNPYLGKFRKFQIFLLLVNLRAFRAVYRIKARKA